MTMRNRFRRWTRRVLRSDVFQAIAARCVHWALLAIYRSNPPVAGSDDLAAAARAHRPMIIALWHGQQLLVQFTRPPGEHVAGLVSRSADAELNARVLELAGNEVIRGSGGRERRKTARKGGVQALIALRNALREGRHVVLIADISKGEPRQAGEGIVTLAKISGRPIVPVALATSRYHVVEKSWDKTTINLPFGRRCLKIGTPIRVSADASDEDIEAARAEVTRQLNDLTEKAYALAEAKR
jgi:lysophospholipid acyltransferase (LPLAT)-like uncharacterized protein